MWYEQTRKYTQNFGLETVMTEGDYGNLIHDGGITF
jgi:hypothetical protein